MKSRICHICSGHTADDGRVFHRACVSLASEGYEVHLIARGEGSQPFTRKGVVVHPMPQPPNRMARMMQRKRIAELASELKPALFHVHEPELLGPVLSRAGSQPVIWDVHESYLDVLLDRAWIPRALRPLARAAWDRRERLLITRCAGIAAATEGVAARYRSLHADVQVIANVPSIHPDPFDPAARRDGRTCVFTGVLGDNRGLHETLSALCILKSRGLRVPLVFAGGSTGYAEQLLREASALDIRDQVNYLGVLTKEEVIGVQNGASIGLVPHLPYGNNLLAWPVKMLEFMSVALPLVYSDLPGHREIVSDSGAGIAVDPTRPEAIADAIGFLVNTPDTARQMGQAGRRAVHERLNWEVESRKLIRLYERCLARHPQSSVNA
jgi:glycosyltransferase involved in cell wall biosynthesis